MRDRRSDNFVTADAREGPSWGIQCYKNRFADTMKQPCAIHKNAGHTTVECVMLKNHFTGGDKAPPPKKKKDREEDDRTNDQQDETNDEFPHTTLVIHMIYNGPAAQETKKKQKLRDREIFNVQNGAPTLLKWSELPITFSWKD